MGKNTPLPDDATIYTQVSTPLQVPYESAGIEENMRFYETGTLVARRESER